MRVFGKSGANLLPMLADLGALRAEARRLGVVMTGGQAQAADALGDAFDRVKTTLGAVATAVGTALAPVLTDLAGRVTGFLIGVREWIAANQGAIRVPLDSARGPGTPEAYRAHRRTLWSTSP